MEFAKKIKPKSISLVDEFYEEQRKERELDASSLTLVRGLVELITIWKEAGVLENMKPELAEAIQVELQIAWGSKARAIIDFDSGTVVATLPGYEKKILGPEKFILKKTPTKTEVWVGQTEDFFNETLPHIDWEK